MTDEQIYTIIKLISFHSEFERLIILYKVYQTYIYLNPELE